jgi:hypothetical protein
MTAGALYDLMQIGILPTDHFNFLEKFSGQQLTDDLADVFNGLVSS